MIRPTPIVSGEYYHILGRGNNKQSIFLDERDYARFLFLILHFQSPVIFENIGRFVDSYIKKGTFGVSPHIVKEIIENKFVDLVGFAIMENHYHLLVYERKEGGISQYMQRNLNAFAKSFNLKYERVGHLFQGPFKAVHIKDNDQLLYLSAYLHLNPRDLKRWRGNETTYHWSSFQDYLDINRWGDLLKNDVILDQFDDKNDYKKFVLNSGAKDIFDEIDEDSKIF